MSQLAGGDLLDQAYVWLCAARGSAGHNHSVWDLRRNWDVRRRRIQMLLRNNTYEFAPCRTWYVDGQCMSCWEAEDSIVQKALSLLLTPLLAPMLSQRCYHLAGRGGCKAAVQRIAHHANNFEFVVKSDVHSYYASMDHMVLQAQLAERIADRGILRLRASFLTQLIDRRGFTEIHRQGIVQGSPLSALAGALYHALERKTNAAASTRHMDDRIVLAPMRRIVRTMNRVPNDVKVSTRRMKTFIGRVATDSASGLSAGLPPARSADGCGRFAADASLPMLRCRSP